jgi:hypothetical protein
MAQDLSLQRDLSKGIVVGVRGDRGDAEAAQAQVAASPGVLAPGLEGTDFRGVRGWGRRPVPRNKHRLRWRFDAGRDHGQAGGACGS